MEANQIPCCSGNMDHSRTGYGDKGTYLGSVLVYGLSGVTAMRDAKYLKHIGCNRKRLVVSGVSKVTSSACLRRNNVRLQSSKVKGRTVEQRV